MRFEYGKVMEKAERLRKIVEEFDERWNEWWNDVPDYAYRVLENREFAPLIATICDEMVGAANAWTIPWWLEEKLGSLEPQRILEGDLEGLLEEYFKSHGRFPDAMDEKDRKDWIKKTSERIKEAVRQIDNPVRIFEDREYPASEVYFMLRQISGIGPKKASMIVRDFLYRSMGIAARHPWYDQIVRISPNFKVVGAEQTLVPVDVHVVKIFNRLFGRKWGDWRREQTEHWWDSDIQMFSRVVFPEFPARLDGIMWYVGSNYCRDRNPECSTCLLAKVCDSSVG